MDSYFQTHTVLLGKEERPRMSHEMLILRGEDGKRWVEVGSIPSDLCCPCKLG